MIFNYLTGKLVGEDHTGAHAVSKDGIIWNLASNPKAYSSNVFWTDGTDTVQRCFVRLQLLIQNGIPTHLFAAVADGPGGFLRAYNT
jgi:hypothetical protein